MRNLKNVSFKARVLEVVKKPPRYGLSINREMMNRCDTIISVRFRAGFFGNGIATTLKSIRKSIAEGTYVFTDGGYSWAMDWLEFTESPTPLEVLGTLEDIYRIYFEALNVRVKNERTNRLDSVAGKFVHAFIKPDWSPDNLAAVVSNRPTHDNLSIFVASGTELTLRDIDYIDIDYFRAEVNRCNDRIIEYGIS